MVVVTNTDGTIVGGMLADAARDANVRVEFRPLPGQTVHEVDVSEHLVKDKSAQELHATFSAYRVASTQSRLVLAEAHVSPRSERPPSGRARRGRS